MRRLYYLLSAAFLCPCVLAQQAPAKAYDLFNSVGVNTHITFGSPYAYLDHFDTGVIPRLQQAHISHIRDSEWGNGANTDPWVTGMFGKLKAAGIRTNLVIVADNWAQTEPQLQADLALYPGVESIEAPNECDLGCNTDGMNWVANVTGKLQIMKPAADALGLPVIGPSLTQGSSFARLGDISQYLTYGNVHDYNGNRNPETTGWGGGVDAQGSGYGSINWNQDMAHVYAPALPVIATETGYQTGSASWAIPETVEGTYAPRLFLTSFKRGIPRTYYYQLLDEPTSWNSTYGLLHYDLTPKPAYTAIKNLQEITTDTTGSFITKPLGYTVTGSTAGVETLLVQKSTGVYWLFVWLNGSVWDVARNVATPVAPLPVTVTVTTPKMYVTYSAQFRPDGTVSKAWPHAVKYSLKASSNIVAMRIYSR